MEYGFNFSFLIDIQFSASFSEKTTLSLLGTFAPLSKVN